MKIRSGFVSNSSSSSFVVNLDKLSKKERRVLLQFNEITGEHPRGWSDHWTITVDEDQGVIRGWTVMDNGDLDEYLEEQHIDDSSFVYESY